ncbi:MAG: hypothetical protein ABI591_23155 [Kofleriaceae bacterium]
MTRTLGIAALLVGCIDIPHAPAPECTVDADCETTLGEVCSSGACYGGPPFGSFAATIAPPSDRADLISVEIPSINLPNNGDLSTFELATPVEINGRVECGSTGCSNTSLAATILVTRAPLFSGGTGFSSGTTSTDGLPQGTNSFSIAVPRSHPGDPPYVVTIVPSGNGALPPANGAKSAAELAPPIAFTVAPTTDTNIDTKILGTVSSQVISGLLTDGANHPLAKYRVVARGKLSATAAQSEVSSVYYTTDGTFALTLADNAVGPISVVATPYDNNVVAPTLTLGGLEPKTQSRTLAQPPNTGNKLVVDFPIKGLGIDGAVKPVAGAHVIVTAELDPPLSDNAVAVLTREVTTDETGVAELTLLDGPTFASSYKLSVIPPASSSLGVVFNTAVDLTTLVAGVLPPVRLPPRVALRGRVVASNGTPVGKLSVTAQPSLRFTWSELGPAAAFLSEIPAPTAVTADAGDFVVYVDLAIDGVWGHYDLSFDPPSGTTLASFTLPDVELPRVGTLTALSLPDATLPDTARLHGTVADPNHFAVRGGELRIFRIVTDSSVCGQVLYPPANCVIPAQLIGHATSDDAGTLQLALPR